MVAVRRLIKQQLMLLNVAVGAGATALLGAGPVGVAAAGVFIYYSFFK